MDFSIIEEHERLINRQIQEKSYFPLQKYFIRIEWKKFTYLGKVDYDHTKV